jgi:5,10-methylenetetrahydrofolate reductase
MPNAGLPKMIHGRLLYLASPEYFAEYARRYAQLGVQLIGGCCGTTPAHIAEMKKYLKTARLGKRVEQDISVIREGEEKPKPLQELPPPILPAQKSPFGAVLGTKFAVSVEVDPPLGIDPTEAIEGARVLKDMGIDAVNIADGPRAMARMSPMALATLIKDQVGIETIVHYCCRDRNLLGMQMDLIGAEALGLHNMLIITGDPPKMGHYPDATAVFDIDSVGLIHFVTNLNNGLDFADRPMKQRTKLLIGCGFNPGAIDLDLEVERYRLKVNAGAEFAFSQPIYEPKLLETFLDRVKSVKQIPIFVGILPLASLRNAEFLHNEVPGMQVPDSIMEMLGKASSKEAQREIGMSVAKETLTEAKRMEAVQGAYIFPPFGNYQAVEKLLEVI